MPVRLRLRRQGRKKAPYYHIVASDASSPRDGKYIEKLGSYDPTRIPANITIDHEIALKWLKNGAEPTDTVNAILSYTGVLLKFHLFRKGKTEDEITAEYEKWSAEQASKINKSKEDVLNRKKALKGEMLKNETVRKEAIAAKIAAKKIVVLEGQAPQSEEAPAEATEE
jgi:small subunit ribosomal protein S16